MITPARALAAWMIAARAPRGDRDRQQRWIGLAPCCRARSSLLHEKVGGQEPFARLCTMLYVCAHYYVILPMPFTKIPSISAARRATQLFFLLAGVASACWAPMIPYAKARLELDEARLGMLLLCLGLG